VLKEKVFEQLMQGDASDIAHLANMLRESIACEIVKGPMQELVMFQVEESVEKIDFNVGEILVTTAEVRVNDVIGYGMVMDVDEQKATDCAFLMAVYESRSPEMQAVENLAEALARKTEKRMQEEKEIVSSTRVQFEVMGGQDPNVAHNA